MSKGLYIGGAWRAGRGAALASLNPATLKPVWEAAAADEQDVAEAVDAARRAFPAWAGKMAEERFAVVQAFRAVLEQEKERFARLIAEETGKMLWDALTEVQAMIGKADISRQAYIERTGAYAKVQGEMTMSLRHRPHGVLAVFGPYNFPGHLPNGHIIPALIAGNTLVFKPSEQTPMVGEAMTALWEKAGLPQGVLNLVQGARETGIALAAQDGIDGLLFTGSAETGAALHRQFAGRPEKILALEMGGNNPLIAWPPYAAREAALLALQSAFLSSGQRCTCARRLIVPAGAEGDELAEALTRLAASIVVGAYTDTPTPYMGPLISNREAERLLQAEAELRAAGAQALLPMRRLKEGYPFVSPGIIDVTHCRERPDKEYFGPLLQVIRVADFDAALAEANRTRFGLAAGLLSGDEALYRRFIGSIRAGVVSWNRPTNGASSALPFGGIGISGNHRPAAYYAADYCAYPVASLESAAIAKPAQPIPGVAYEPG